MGTILGKGFAQAHTEFIAQVPKASKTVCTSAWAKPFPKIVPMSKLHSLRDVNSRELVLRKNLASTVLRPLIHKFLLLGYFLGLLTATVSSEFFKAAQPALLYLVPFTLFPLFLMAYLKGDLRSMWEVDFTNNNYTKLPKCQVIWKKKSIP